ncbi:MAG TPA: hypothetical protein VMR70_03595 [Flavisolibacter sp.]|nr:hypothetical protein [Flavisolibacter sp.]
MIRLLFFSVVTFFLSSCGSVSSFESPNSLRNMNGTLFLRNGKSIDGKLVVQVGNMFSSDVKIYEEGDKKPMNFSVKEVAGYRIHNDHYFLKEKKSGLGRRQSFMRRITPADSRIHLYEEQEKVSETSKANGVTNSRTRYEKEYYLQLPNEPTDDVYSLGSSRFVPNFDEKMSRIVSDCPALAQKISSKADGYFYAQIGLFKEKRVNVLMTIIEEYNRCW